MTISSVHDPDVCACVSVDSAVRSMDTALEDQIKLHRETASAFDLPPVTELKVGTANAMVAMTSGCSTDDIVKLSEQNTQRLHTHRCTQLRRMICRINK